MLFVLAIFAFLSSLLSGSLQASRPKRNWCECVLGTLDQDFPTCLQVHFICVFRRKAHTQALFLSMSTSTHTAGEHPLAEGLTGTRHIARRPPRLLSESVESPPSSFPQLHRKQKVTQAVASPLSLILSHTFPATHTLVACVFCRVRIPCCHFFFLPLTKTTHFPPS